MPDQPPRPVYRRVDLDPLQPGDRAALDLAAECQRLRAELRAAEAERDKLRTENDRLREKIDDLQDALGVATLGDDW